MARQSPRLDAERGIEFSLEGPARLRVNNSFAVRDAIERGLGIGQLPLLVAAPAVAAGRLARVLPGWAAPPVPVHAVYPSNRYLSPKVRAFIDLALEWLPEASRQARRTVEAAPRPKAAAPVRARAAPAQGRPSGARPRRARRHPSSSPP